MFETESLYNIILEWCEIKGIELCVDYDSELLYYYDDDLNYKIFGKYNKIAMRKLIEKFKMKE